MIEPVATCWVVTWLPSDGGAIHAVTDNEEHARMLVEDVPGGVVAEVPATWSCDGRDGCMEQA